MSFNLLRRFSINARLFLGAMAILATGESAFMVLQNLYVKSLGFGESVVGLVSGMHALAVCLFSLPAVRLFRRFAARDLLIAAVLLEVAGQLLFVSSSALVVLAAGKLIAGAGSAFLMISASPFLMRHSGEGERTALFATSQGCMVAGGALGSFAAGFLSDQLMAAGVSETAALARTMMVFALVAVGCTMLLIRIHRAPVEALASMASEKGLGGWRQAWRIPRTVRRILAVNITIGLGAGMTIPFLNLYFKDRFAMPAAEIGTWFAVSQVFLVVGVFLGPLLARRAGHVMAIVLTQVFSVPFMLILAFTQNAGWAITAFLMRSTLMNMGSPLVSQFSMEAVPDGERARTNALKVVTWNLSWVISGYVGGLVIESSGYQFTIVATAVLYSVASLAFWSWFRPRAFRAPAGELARESAVAG